VHKRVGKPETSQVIQQKYYVNPLLLIYHDASNIDTRCVEGKLGGQMGGQECLRA
jgi:hypothetical protein